MAVFIACTGSPSNPDGSRVDTTTPASPSQSALDNTERAAALPKQPGARATDTAAPVPSRAPEAYFGHLKHPRRAVLPVIQGGAGSSIVLIVIDALNAKHMGAYGYQRDTTPHIDHLAQTGILFSNYVSNSSWTRPSFTTIITGLPKKQHKVELSSRNVEKNITTLAERFRAAGYRTAGFVGNPLVRQIWGFGQGFQIYEDTHSLKKAFPLDAVLADKAMTWLDRIGDDPFFLMIFFTAPHTPYRPPRGFRKFLDQQPKGRVIEYPFREYKTPLPKGDHQRIVAAYDDEIAYTDHQIGRLMAHLEKTGKLGRTSILVTADHGEAFGDHNCYQHSYHMWESVLRVPFILASPFLNARGVLSDAPVTHVDIVPTAIELADIKDKKSSLPGVSVLSRISRTDTAEDRILFSQYNAHGIRRQAIRKGAWKLIHFDKIAASALKKLNSLERSIPHANPRDLPSLVRSLNGARFAFFNLANDPDEQTDLFDADRARPELIELTEALKHHLGIDDAPAELSDELRRALEAAGYFVSDN
ncbi:MAG: sulfatase [Myxococcota bacterium]|nr:sulfatase [Myxococcota bacterium]